MEDLNKTEQNIIKKERKKGIIFSIVCSAITFVLGISLAGYIGIGNSNVDKDLENFIYYYEILKNEWIFGNDETTDAALKAAINAIYNENYDIDPYTYFVESPVISDTDDNTPPPPPAPVKYGIGLSTKYNVDQNGCIGSDGIIVYDVFVDGGSYGKLEIGDQLIGCYNGEEYISFIGKKYSEIENYIKSEEKGSELKVSYIRNNITSDAVVKRIPYKSTTVFENEIDKKVCSNCISVKITQFNNSTSIYFEDVMDEIVEREKSAGNKTTDQNLIIDLRNNPGGYVTSFMNVASYFLPSGLDLLYYKHKDGHISLGGSSSGGIKYKFNSINILLNEHSASASEAFALALKDYSKHLNNNVNILGTKSFGKGIAQNEVPLPDGSSIRYTFAYTLSPNKTSIHGIGINPDYEIFAPNPNYISALQYINEWKNQLDSAASYISALGGK